MKLVRAARDDFVRLALTVGRHRLDAVLRRLLWLWGSLSLRLIFTGAPVLHDDFQIPSVPLAPV